MPVGVEVFVREVAGIRLRRRVEPHARHRVLDEIRRPFLTQPADEPQRRLRRLVRAARIGPGQPVHQPLHRQQRRPPRQRVGTDIDEPARPEEPVEEGDDIPPGLGTDPAPDPVQGHDVEFRPCPRRRRGQVGKAALLEVRIPEPGLLGQAPGALDVPGVEIEAPDLGVRVGGGDHRGGDAKPAAEVGDKQPPARIGGPVAEQEANEVQPGRRHLADETAGIFGVGHIALIPARHGRIPGRKLTPDRTSGRAMTSCMHPAAARGLGRGAARTAPAARERGAGRTEMDRPGGHVPEVGAPAPPPLSRQCGTVGQRAPWSAARAKRKGDNRANAVHPPKSCNPKFISK